MFKSNVSKCSQCGLDLIDEERVSHICERKDTEYRIEGNILYYFDGFRWYKHVLSISPEMKRLFFSPEDGREPKKMKLLSFRNRIL